MDLYLAFQMQDTCEVAHIIKEVQDQKDRECSIKAEEGDITVWLELLSRLGSPSYTGVLAWTEEVQLF